MLRRLFKYTAWLIRPFERGLVARFAGKDKSAQCSPVFIIGLPRSGSTVLYQLITDMFDVTYFDNLVNLGRENIHFSVQVSKILFKNRPHRSYTSKYGNTTSEGLHAPAEAGPLWYRWFPKDVSEVTMEMMSPKKMRHMKATVCSIMKREKKPLIVKNLHMILRMKVLREVFPDARYIYIRRDPLFIAQSIYLGRQKNLDDIQAEWWSVPFPGYESLLGAPVEKQIAHQVVELQRIIEHELSMVSKKNIFRLDYESLDLHSLQSELGAFLLAQPREGFSADDVRMENRNARKLEEHVLEKLQSEMNRIFED